MTSCLRRRAHLSCLSRATWRSTWQLYAHNLCLLGSSRWTPEVQVARGPPGTSSTWSALTLPPRARPRCLDHLHRHQIFTQQEATQRTRGTVAWRTASRTSATCTRPLILILTLTRPPPIPAAGTCTRTSLQGGTWQRPPAPFPTTHLHPTTLLPNRQ